MSVVLLDGATILSFVEDETAFGRAVEGRFASLDADGDCLLSRADMAGELHSLRVFETHFGVDVRPDPDEEGRVYESIFAQFDRDGSGAVDLGEFMDETRKMMVAVASGLGFLPLEMVVEPGSFLEWAVEKAAAKGAAPQGEIAREEEPELAGGGNDPDIDGAAESGDHELEVDSVAAAASDDEAEIARDGACEEPEDGDGNDPDIDGPAESSEEHDDEPEIAPDADS